MDRHQRQMRLAEVGAAGQRAIARAWVDVPLVGFAGEVAARYLAGAGALGVRVRDDGAAAAARATDPAVKVERLEGGHGALAEPLDFGLRDDAASELARGAHHALARLREALGGGQ